ncbi:MAG: tRNA 2-selenouridine(34) synthase MnmH [Chitinophagaceae bacterium]|nr:MAG: tRNA 2-selenouridine(34) synthase MnmH [Chitinophagaceae bacterium]
MIDQVSIDEFLVLQSGLVVADVRTPDEYLHGHIPGAVNLPLFSNEERVLVGTTYKQAGREQAVLLGFEITGPKWAGFIRDALALAPSRKIALHCWRGGMRSGAMAWALDFFGFDVYLLQGGYKAYRKWAHHQFARQYHIHLLGGKSGSGKTILLRQLRAKGEAVIDLEDLAQHQGSTYGTLNRMVQPSQEQFENNLAVTLSAISEGERLWVEDESISIGKRFIPRAFWNQMCAADLYDIRITDGQRVQNLLREYGPLDKDYLADCTQRIWKRLGHERTANAITAIREDRMADFIQHLLVYYDKTYTTSVSMRPASSVVPVPLLSTDLESDITALLASVRQLQTKQE